MIMGKTDLDFSYTQAEALAYRAADQQVITSGQATLGVEEIVTLPTGETRWLETNRLPLRDLAGQVVATVGTFQDITRRKQVELERQGLVQELAAFKRALDESAIVAITDVHGVITYVNDRFEEISGYTQAELVGQTHRLVNSGYHSPYFFQSLWHTILQGQVWRGEICNRAKSGHTYWVDSTIVPLLEDQGHPVQFLVVRFDITARKQAELALRESNALLSTISQAQAQFITAANRPDIFENLLNRLLEITHSEYGLVVEVAESAGAAVMVESLLKIKGVPDLQIHSLHPSPCQEPTPRDPALLLDLAPLQPLLARVITTGQPVIHGTSTPGFGPWAIKTFLGLPFFQGTTLVGVVGIANCPDGYDEDLVDYLDPFLVTCSNLVEGYRLDRERRHTAARLHQTNGELARATRLKDEFLANMSHELRTPLNAILGMSEGLQEQIFGPINERQAKALSTIERSGSHLLELINDILDVAKIESGQVELDWVPISVTTLCQSSLAFINQQALKKRLQIRTQVPPHLSPLWGDERRLRQVLINLLANAVKFTPEGGQITLQVAPLDPEKISPPTGAAASNLAPLGWLRIAVTDTGIGIAPEHLNYLFQPFIQIDSTLNRQYPGTGLGLALVKRLVHLHGGQVGLTSELGVGSCFTVDLPWTTTVPKAQLPAAPDPDYATTEEEATRPLPLILLAEDNQANISTLSSYLGAKGFRLTIAYNGEDAIAQAQAQKPDLILMDIQMPGMDGLEAMEHLRRIPDLADIPIIALTALVMAEDRDRCLAAGATDYLPKPVRLKELTQRIQALLGR
jgi:PAS domain S-box-containing protein